MNSKVNQFHSVFTTTSKLYFINILENNRQGGSQARIIVICYIQIFFKKILRVALYADGIPVLLRQSPHLHPSI